MGLEKTLESPLVCKEITGKAQGDGMGRGEGGGFRMGSMCVSEIKKKKKKKR